MCIELHLNPRAFRPKNATNSYHFNAFHPSSSLARKLHSLYCLGQWAGGFVTTLFGSTSFGSISLTSISVPKKKRTLLPLLTVLFVFSYGLMTLLIVEQGAAIESQRNLIKILMPESRELWSLRGKALSDKQAQIEAHKHAQTPSDQAPSNQTPSNQVPQRQSRTGRTAKPQLPPVPASDLGDQRRALRTI